MNSKSFKNWKKFPIIDFFNIKNTHSILKKDIVENSGIHPYVTAKEGNNSVESYISYDMEKIEKGNSILIGGKTLVISYQPYDYFSNDSHNLALYLKDESKATKNIQLFLVVSLKASLSSLYTWGDSISKRTIVKDYVFLPSNDGVKPDWTFMENYINNVENETNNALSDLKSATTSRTPNLDLCSWKEFHIYDVFEIDSGNKFDKSKMDTSTEAVDFVGRSNFNNGVTTKVNVFNDIKPYEKGNLTLALGGAYLGSCFVQINSFYTSQNVVVLKPKNDISWEAKQFIATAIFIESQNNYRAFIKELNAHIKRDFSFMLPAKEEKVPDYEYMTDYIKNVQKEVKNSFSSLRALL